MKQAYFLWRSQIFQVLQHFLYKLFSQQNLGRRHKTSIYYYFLIYGLFANCQATNPSSDEEAVSLF